MIHDLSPARSLDGGDQVWFHIGGSHPHGGSYVSNPFEVWLDEERQIIRQRMHGEPDLEQFQAFEAATAACVRRLRCPTDVRILADGKMLGRMRKSVRALAVESLRRPDLKRVAVVTKSLVVRVLIRFLCVVTGLEKIRVFPDEAAALDWLLS